MTVYKPERLTPLLLGPVPPHWESAFIDELTDMLTNGFVGPSLPHQTDDLGGILYLQGFNVRPNKIRLDKVTKVTKEFHLKNKKSCLKERDLLVVQSGHIGTAAVVPPEIAGANCHALIIVRFKLGKVNPHFVSQYINSHLGQARLRGLEVGSSLPHINTSELGRFRIPVPPMKEQDQLVSILATWDDAIEKSEQLIATKEKRYAYELNRLIEYRECTLKASFADILTESRVPAAQVDNQKLLSVRLYCNGVERREPRNQNGEEAGTQYFARRSGQLIYGKQNIFRGAIGLVPKEFDGYLSSQDLPAFDVDEKFDPRWVYYYMSRPGFYRRLEALSAGSGSKRLHPDELYKLHVHFPRLETQTKIADTIELMLRELELEQRRLELLKTQKRGLMQKLLTGQWRVKVPAGAEVA